MDAEHLRQSAEFDQRCAQTKDAWLTAYVMNPDLADRIINRVTSMQSDNARPGGDLVSRFVACLAEYAIVKIVDDLKQEATDGPTQQG